MKINNFKNIIFAVFFGVGFVPAAFAQNVAMLGLTISSSTISASSSIDSVIATDTIKFIKKERKEFKDSCEAFAAIDKKNKEVKSDNKEVKAKIKSIEKTLEEESAKRESIISNIKNMFSLKKTDRQNIIEMKKILNKSYAYYLDMDNKILDLETTLDDKKCEDFKLVDLTDTFSDLEDMQIDEQKFRKEISFSLKDKIKTASKEVEKKSK